MDPFIETCGRWEDFHAKLIGALEETLSALVPQRYFVGIGERYYVVVSAGEGEVEHEAGSDVGVRRHGGGGMPGEAPGSRGSQAMAAATDAPVTMRAFVEKRYRETFVEIRQVQDQQLVTVLEVLSPSNKRPGTEGWKLYGRKRQACFEDDSISLVELDLLRGGKRQPMIDPWPPSPYYVLVKRRGQGQECSVWPAHSLRPLPRVPVPLADADPDVEVELQPLVEAIYERSRYFRVLDYGKPAPVALEASELEWLSARLPAGQAGQSGQ